MPTRPASRVFAIVAMLMFAEPLGWRLANAQSVATPEQPRATTEQGVFKHAVVAADHVLASQAGVEILRKGGNVVDAAVATGFALSVVHPASSGVGGGGFMVIWNAKNQQAVALDYRERAPRKATRDMFADPRNPRKVNCSLSRRGHLAVAVPGHVAGLCFAVKQYGKLDLPTVLAPAIRLAREGIPIDEHARRGQQSMVSSLFAGQENRKQFGTLLELYLNSGKPWQPGERFYSPLAKLLERIAKFGAAGFYEGPVADALVKHSRAGGGLLTHADLTSMQPVVRPPIRGSYRGLDILTMPPPSSGGIALLEILNILDAYESTHPKETLERLGHNRPEYLHLLTEAMKHAFADRAEFLGDADFVNVPVNRLIDRKYAAELAARIDKFKTRPLKAYGRFLPVDDAGTSHFSVIDRHGNAVACTETINTGYGSLVVEPQFGIVLNNEMDDFAAVPGQPNVFGLVQSEANAVQPGKKPLSSMTPTIVIENGKAVHVLGASGGPRIISTTLQVLLNLTRFKMQPDKAVRLPRFHHQWLPNTLFAEQPLDQIAKAAMESRGHSVQQRNNLAVSQVASRYRDGLRGASDPRKLGQHAGY